MKKVIGIDRKIKRHWLDILLDRFVFSPDETDLRVFLDDQLKAELPGAASRKKSVGILLKIWCGIPEKRFSLRERAVALLPRISGHERIWLHWGMMSLAYPFFRDSAEVIGRLLALQDDFTGANVQSRLTSAWGDRVTTKMAAQKLVHTLVDWEVLRTTKKQGHFLLVQKAKASTPELQLWLLEALLGASDADEIEAQQLLRLPESFPFTINVGVADLRRHEGFNIHRQGLDMDMVALRPVKISLPPRPEEKPTPSAQQPDKPARRRKATLFEELGDELLPESSSSKGTKSSKAKPQKVRKTAAQRRVEKQIRDEFLRSIDERIARTLAIGNVAASDGHHAQPIAECARLFRDGYFFGCLALGRDLLEVIVLELAQSLWKKAPAKVPGVEKNLEVLCKKKMINNELKQQLADMWGQIGLNQQTIGHANDDLPTTSLTLLTLLLQLEKHSENPAPVKSR